MRIKRIALIGTVAISAIAVSLLLITALASAQPASVTLPLHAQEEIDLHHSTSSRSTQAVSVTFPPGPWPWYAQEEIVVHPEPPVAGHPTEICASVMNDDPTSPHTATLEFRIANFGIGVPFATVGEAGVEVPPGGFAEGCVMWIPPDEGHWCIEVLLWQPGAQEPQRSQRNIDIWEPLVPGQPHDLVFPVGPLPEPGFVSFTIENVLPGWDVILNPPEFFLDNGVVQPVTLTTVPPAGAILGTRMPLADVEGFFNGEPMGGFRKMDTPPVPLHRPKDPFFAESEIHVWPYPPRPGEPTEICVELYNLSGLTRTVEVQFNWANFGIGLPFNPIGPPIVVEIPPHSHRVVCTWWVPPFEGHFCIQVELNILGDILYHPQFSQLNLDVAEPLMPGVEHTTQFSVGNYFNEFTNPAPVMTTISLTGEIHLPGWIVELIPPVLPDVLPGDERLVTLRVVPPPEPEPLPPDGTPIVDVRALVGDVEGPRVIGGFRKIFRPPVPLHRYPDPPYAEREISIHPYPPLAGEPTEICVELYNPTPLPQDVTAFFSWANFGIGLPWTPINGPRPVHLPPFSAVRECIHWIPPHSGHFCVQVELEMDGHHPQRSQRNIDVDEPLIPGEPHTLPFPVRNPFDHAVDIELGLIPHLPDWEFQLLPDFLPAVPAGEEAIVELTVIPPDRPLPEDNVPIVDVEAYAEGHLIGGFRKIHHPPIRLHPFPDPPYAEREISVHPYPPLAGEPTEVCVELRNPTPDPHDVTLFFSWANFGIGLPWTPINGPRPVHLPRHSIVQECIHWIPPMSGHVCLQVELEMAGQHPQRSQRNIDIDEPLEQGIGHPLVFTVGNPSDQTANIELGLIPHVPVPPWEITLEPMFLENVLPGHERPVTLTVKPPADEPLPGEEETVLVDVEAFIGDKLIGGFRKIHRPPVPIHQPQDPVYAEREILVHPYPPRAFEPTELAAEIRNPTDEWQTIEVLFSVAPFGIGLPFEPVNAPIIVSIPPHGMVIVGTMWIPPQEGLWCIQVEIFIPGHDEPFWSRLNLDVGEPLEPGQPHARPFLVGNPNPVGSPPITITLGLIPHFPDWGLELSKDFLPNIPPGVMETVILTVTPPADLPEDGDPIVDVEAFVDGELLGGFRKIFHPPVPIHRPRDPIYAESEIGVDPYPVLPGQPVELSVEVFNPTDEDRIVMATFSVAPFGIGLPFSTDGIGPDNPIAIFVPAHGAARGHVTWEPPEGFFGKFCVRVELETPGHEMVWSQRNIDMGEPLEPGQPHSMTFPVGRGAYTQPVTVTLGLINHRDDFETDMSSDSFFDVFYEIEIDSDEPVSVTLIVTPSESAPLGTGEPIVDVEAYVEGELLGGFRKLDVPPIPLHKPHEKTYAETELSIIPDPPRLGEPARIGAEMQNNGAVTSTIILEFGYARFGVGIPFTTTGMVPYTRSLELGPMMTDTAWVTWTPTFSGSHCVMVKLIDPDGTHEDLVSQRNVWVRENPPCGTTQVFTLILYNDSPDAVMMDIGMMTFDVPEEWTVTTVPSGTVKVEANSELTVEIHVLIPCPSTSQAMASVQEVRALQEGAGGVPTIDVEGYIDGKLVGGIEIQLPYKKRYIYLPIVMKNW